MSAKMGLGRGFGSLGGKLLGLICVVSAVAACSKPQPPAAVTSASEAVAATHQLALRETQLTPTPETDPRWADTQKGLIAKPEGQIKNAAGEVIWDFEAFNFVKGDAPNTVNPSLWRQAILNNQAGLYKVKDRVYQVRGFDLSNMTLIEGQTGWIVVDTLTAEETARAAMAFVDKHLGKKPVSAIVYTHSHVDHFGGTLGILSTDEANKRKVPMASTSAVYSGASKLTAT